MQLPTSVQPMPRAVFVTQAPPVAPRLLAVVDYAEAAPGLPHIGAQQLGALVPGWDLGEEMCVPICCGIS